MKRREYVLGLASSLPLLSGCATVLANNETPKQEKSGTPDNTDSTTHLTLSIESRLTSIEAQYEVSLLRGVTQKHPPQIKATFTNTSDSRRQFMFGPKAPLSPQASDSPKPKLHLRTPPSDGTYEADGCWRSPSNAWLSNATTATLQPGESVSNRLDVLAAPNIDGDRYCLPKGNFTFINKVPAYVPTFGGDLGDKVGEGTLRFTLTVR